MATTQTEENSFFSFLEQIQSTSMYKCIKANTSNRSLRLDLWFSSHVAAQLITKYEKQQIF